MKREVVDCVFFLRKIVLTQKLEMLKVGLLHINTQTAFKKMTKISFIKYIF